MSESTVSPYVYKIFAAFAKATSLWWTSEWFRLEFDHFSSALLEKVPDYYGDFHFFET